MTGGPEPAQVAEQMTYSDGVKLVKAFARVNRLDRCTIAVQLASRPAGVVPAAQ